IQQTSGDAISELRARLTSMEAELATAQSRSALLETLCQRIMKHVEQVQQNIEAIDQRVEGVKDGVEVLSEGSTVLQDYVHSRVQEFEQTLKTQRTTIASVTSSQKQTDDVVEGVVGAMELLHTSVFDRAGEFN